LKNRNQNIKNKTITKMKSLKIAIIALFSMSVLASCESTEITPSSDNFSVVVPETRDFEPGVILKGQGTKVENGETIETTNTRPVTDHHGTGISKEATLITD
jgi:hypothetical protein